MFYTGSAADHARSGERVGTTSLVLNEAGDTIVAESRHYPYGEERWRSGTLPTDYRFTGQPMEQALGIYVMGVRWYEPSLGRWLSADTLVPDPADPQSFNRYSWVLANPLKFIDPSGFCEGTAEDHPASENACWDWIA